MKREEEWRNGKCVVYEVRVQTLIPVDVKDSGLTLMARTSSTAIVIVEAVTGSEHPSHSAYT